MMILSIFLRLNFYKVKATNIGNHSILCNTNPIQTHLYSLSHFESLNTAKNLAETFDMYDQKIISLSNFVCSNSDCNLCLYLIDKQKNELASQTQNNCLNYVFEADLINSLAPELIEFVTNILENDAESFLSNTKRETDQQLLGINEQPINFSIKSISNEDSKTHDQKFIDEQYNEEERNGCQSKEKIGSVSKHTDQSIEGQKDMNLNYKNQEPELINTINFKETKRVLRKRQTSFSKNLEEKKNLK